MDSKKKNVYRVRVSLSKLLPSLLCAWISSASSRHTLAVGWNISTRSVASARHDSVKSLWASSDIFLLLCSTPTHERYLLCSRWDSKYIYRKNDISSLSLFFSIFSLNSGFDARCCDDGERWCRWGLLTCSQHSRVERDANVVCGEYQHCVTVESFRFFIIVAKEVETKRVGRSRSRSMEVLRKMHFRLLRNDNYCLKIYGSWSSFLEEFFFSSLRNNLTFCTWLARIYMVLSH